MGVSGTADSVAVAGVPHFLGSGAILIAAIPGALLLFETLWRRSALEDVARQPGGWMGAVVMAACSAVAHELLHGAGWMAIARVPRSAIAFRPTWRGMGVAARLEAAVPARAYRAGVALPALVLGALAVAIGMGTGNGLFVLWGTFFLLECYTDFAVLLATGRVPGGALVREDPERLGCRVTVDAVPLTRAAGPMDRRGKGLHS